MVTRRINILICLLVCFSCKDQHTSNGDSLSKPNKNSQFFVALNLTLDEPRLSKYFHFEMENSDTLVAITNLDILQDELFHHQLFNIRLSKSEQTGTEFKGIKVIKFTCNDPTYLEYDYPRQGLNVKASFNSAHGHLKLQSLKIIER